MFVGVLITEMGIMGKYVGIENVWVFRVEWWIWKVGVVCGCRLIFVLLIYKFRIED